MNRKGQLFLIEVIIAISVLLILVTTLFSTQNFSPPVQNSNLQESGEQAINSLVENGKLFTYLEGANYSYYQLGDDIWDETNSTKIDTANSIEASLPLIANFKVFTDRYNEVSNTWEQIDVINFAFPLPQGYDISIVEYYTPGFNGVYAQFKIKLFVWYEVDI